MFHTGPRLPPGVAPPAGRDRPLHPHQAAEIACPPSWHDGRRGARAAAVWRRPWPRRAGRPRGRLPETGCWRGQGGRCPWRVRPSVPWRLRPWPRCCPPVLRPSRTKEGTKKKDGNSDNSIIFLSEANQPYLLQTAPECSTITHQRNTKADWEFIYFVPVTGTSKGLFFFIYRVGGKEAKWKVKKRIKNTT